MRIGHDYRLYPWVNNWPRMAQMLDVNKDELTARVVELAGAAPDAFGRAEAAINDEGDSCATRSMLGSAAPTPASNFFRP